MSCVPRPFYKDGVFKPVTPVMFKENQRVSLKIESLERQEADEWREWLVGAQQLSNSIQAERGILPDSTLDIAEDCTR